MPDDAIQTKPVSIRELADSLNFERKRVQAEHAVAVAKALDAVKAAVTDGLSDEDRDAVVDLADYRVLKALGPAAIQAAMMRGFGGAGKGITGK